MEAFRETPPIHIGGLDVVEVHDYKTHEVRQVAGGSRPASSSTSRPPATC